MSGRNLLEKLQQSASNGDVGKRYAFANKEGALSQNGVQDRQDAGDVTLGLLIGIFVEVDDAKSGVHPDA